MIVCPSFVRGKIFTARLYPPVHGSQRHVRVDLVEHQRSARIAGREPSLERRLALAGDAQLVGGDPVRRVEAEEVSFRPAGKP